MTGPIASVVVPAHDEGARITRTLMALLGDARPGEFEVVIVCNGCSDDTAARARRVAGVRVEELATPSKVGALRHGDDVATAFPRLYLDGDVDLPTAAARALVAALDTDQPRAAGVVGHVDATASTLPARWYFDFRQRLPVFDHGIIGAGVYGLNRAGRRRLGAWPDILGDDQFVLRSFDDHERITVRGHRTHVAMSTDLRSVVRRQLRVRRGNEQLGQGASDHAPLPAPPAGIATALRAVLASPPHWPGAITWTIVNLYVRLRLRLGRATGDWHAAG